MKPAAFFIFLALFGISCSPKQDDPFIAGFEEYPTLRRVLGDRETYQAQVIYTQIDRNEHGNPMFTDFTFNLDDDHYFYPASTVKLPIALLALEWLEEQDGVGLDPESIMLTDSVRPSQLPVLGDSSSENLLPSIGHYIKKILLVSDNDAANRLYELLGLDYINSKLREKGLDHTVITQRLSFPISPEENRHFNPVRFLDKSGKTLLEIPARHTDSVYVVPGRPRIGKAHYRNDSLFQEGMDFSFKNKFALTDLHGVVQRIIFPQAFMESERLKISDENRNFVLRYMSMLPRESTYPHYDSSEYYDGYAKFFKFGASKDPIPHQYRIFNKTGWSYGYLIDGSYMVDFDNGVEFFVSAVVYTNENQTLNDGVYETEEIGKPFFSELGDYLYQRELKRKKQIPADLQPFKFDYSSKPKND
jgi:hypothetical protein